MKTKKSPCDSCAIKGYSLEICKKHLEHMAHEKSSAKKTGLDPQLKSLAGKAAVGAGIGVGICLAGMAVAPAIGAKALLGHLIAAKVTGAGGAVGASAGVALNKIKKTKRRLPAKGRKTPRSQSIKS
jgi:hypothetical protein